MGQGFLILIILSLQVGFDLCHFSHQMLLISFNFFSRSLFREIVPSLTYFHSHESVLSFS